MEQFLLFLPAIFCPVGMGLLMWLMMRGGKNNGGGTAAEKEAELADLRAQLEALRPAPNRDLGPLDVLKQAPHPGGAPSA
ncbi:hypothetical protein [Arthrobacter sp. Leaf137]|uniref:hypothetical protein n=1 Tax=Arthrobacter sp. Leaf137 TaxID=1736271 RepID=UPI00070014BC|nr:hypothetical protein [Arthrobacter sp. Leaf137]KQQ80944.1 hypothetical protein ASF64_12965 [Arthrobacter sp. Leaf137]